MEKYQTWMLEAWESGQSGSCFVYTTWILIKPITRCHETESDRGEGGSLREPPLTGSWLLEELAEKIETADEARSQTVARTLFQHPPYVAALVRALDEGLEVVGRNGSEVVDAILIGRYGLHKEDVAYNPGEYMSAMKDILDAGCEVLERVMLEEIRKETGILAMTVEEAAFKVKGYYGELTESERHLGVRIEHPERESEG
jgi:hypothetical protein